MPSDAIVSLVVGLVVAGISIGVVIRVLVPLLAGNRRNKQLKTHGTAASAIIVGISQTGMRVNDQPQCRMQLQIKQPDGGSFMSSATQIVSIVEIPRFQPGAAVSVRYDPADPSHAVIVGFGSHASVSEQDAQGLIATSQALLVDLNRPGVGTPATAIVTEFDRTNVVVNNQSVLATVSLKVLCEQAPPFDAKITGAFSLAGLDKYQPGKTVHVLFDAQNPSRTTFNLGKTSATYVE